MAEVAQMLGDAELVRRALSGETAAFEKLVERHFRIVHAIAYGRLRDRDMAEDLSQEVFLRVYLFLDKVENPERFAAWVTRVTRNLAEDWARRGQRASRLIPMVAMEELHEEIADERAEDQRQRLPREEQDRAVREAIFRLPAMQRGIVMLHYTEGLSQKDIADHLAVHPSTVGRQLKSALAAMQGHLEPILRESAPSLGAAQRATARAIALVAAAAFIPQAAKASILAAASDAAWTTTLHTGASATAGSTATVLGLFHTMSAALAAGGKMMMTGKGVAAVIAAAIGAGGTAYYMMSESGTGAAANAGSPIGNVAAVSEPVNSTSAVPGAAQDTVIGSKTQRVAVDMRSMQTALEAFFIDNNRFPDCITGTDQQGNKYSVFAGPSLTTPIAYLRWYSADPFSPDGRQTFRYYVPPPNGKPGWILYSPGPDGKYAMDWNAYRAGDPQSSLELLTRYTYDPTNGAVSPGDIWRARP